MRTPAIFWWVELESMVCIVTMIPRRVDRVEDMLAGPQRRMGHYHNRIATSNQSSSSDTEYQALKAFIARAASDSSVLADESASASFLAHQIAHKILDVTLKPADTAVELMWFRSAFGMRKLEEKYARKEGKSSEGKKRR